MSDLTGKWRVQAGGRWTWIYDFDARGFVTWTDPTNGMTGKGTWRLGNSRVDFVWSQSPTKEHWNLADGPGEAAGRAEMSVGVVVIAAVKLQALPSFLIPPGGAKEAGKYTASGELWRVEVGMKERIIVGLKNPSGLKVTSNNPAVADVGAPFPDAGLMKVPILGVTLGNAMIEAKDQSGKVLAFIQLQVLPARADYGLLAQGRAVYPKVAEIIRLTQNLPDPGPFAGPFGMITLRRGGVWDSTKMIIYTDHQHTVYVVDDKLYDIKTADFVRNLFLDPITVKMREARWMVVVTKVMFSFIQGLLVGSEVLVLAKVAELGLWSAAHPDLVRQCANGLVETQRVASLIKQRYPALWEKLRNALLLTAAQSVPEAMVETFKDPNTAAFFIGRILQGLKDAPSVTFGLFLKITVKCAGIIAGLHLGPSIVHVQANKTKQLADQLMKDLQSRNSNMPVSEAEAKRMAEELVKFSDSGRNLEDLNTAVTKWVTVLNQLHQDFEDVK